MQALKDLEWLKEWMEIYIRYIRIPEAYKKIGILMPDEKTYFPRTFQNFDDFKKYKRWVESIETPGTVNIVQMKPLTLSMRVNMKETCQEIGGNVKSVCGDGADTQVSMSRPGKMMRIAQEKEVGARHPRKLRKFSPGFNEKFSFFLKCYRTGLLDFCGEDVVVESQGTNAKEAFRLFDDGHFEKTTPKSIHPNILKAVITGKKAWGLWLNQWAQGIADWTFTEGEILAEFIQRGIVIPDAFLQDFRNRINKLKQQRYH